MRKLLAVLALLLTSSAALAQGHPPPSCWPSRLGGFIVPGGTGSPVTYDAVQELGVYWVWRCPSGNIAYWAAKENWKAPFTWEVASTIANAASAIDALTELWIKYSPRQAACTPQDPCDPDWHQLSLHAIKAGGAIPVPGRVQPFVVAKNGTVTTRPAYPVTGGVVDATVGGRAPVGQPCDCEKTRIEKGTTTYCAAPAPIAHLVTVCRQP